VIPGMIHFSLAKHYCSEMEVISKVSLSGKSVCWGMEETEERCPVSGSA